MTTELPLSQRIDERNDKFTNGVKERLLPELPRLNTDALEWLIKEHYQFSFANVDLLTTAVRSTAKLTEQGVTVELQRNVDEEDGHAPMYRQGMLDVGTDVRERVEFGPTTEFLNRVRGLSGPNPSRALGALYATETAAIFEHETLFDVCKEICDRRGITYEGTLIKQFHDLHLDGGVEQGHKDGLAAFVDLEEPQVLRGAGERLNKADVEEGALQAIDAMQVWWNVLLDGLFASATSAVTR
ncbi:MAG: hypothetical protein LC647_10560 [Beggiatoa sp.]|nr:hypothetical protein [Beggiatoa sp.]